MALIYDTAVKNDRMEAVMTYFSNGTIELTDSAETTVLVVFGLGAPAGSVTGNVWTLTPLDAAGVATAVGTGTAAKARIKNSGGSAHITGLTVTATGGGGNVILDNISIATSQTVTLSAATITHAT